MDQRTQVVFGEGEHPMPTVLYEPVTPAVLAPYGAFGALAIVAVVLDGMGPGGGAGHAWELHGGAMAITLPSFLEWLGARPRRWLGAAAAFWDHPVGAAFGATTGRSGVAATA